MRKIHRYLRRSLVPNLAPASVRNFAIIGLIPLIALSVYLLLSTIQNLQSRSAPRLKNGTGNNLYVAGNKIYRTTIGTKAGEPKVTFSVGDSHIGFVLAGIDKVTPKKESSNSVLFPSVQPDTDLRYTTTPNGLKEELILHSAQPRSNVFLFDLSLTGVTPKKLTNDFIDPSFQDDKGTYLFHFDKPFAVDAGGNRTNNVLLQIGQEKLTPSSEPCEGECSELYAPKYFMKLIVDQTWLSDPARVYPIVIDPTILHDTTAEFVAGTLNRLKDTGPGATATLESYYQELPTDQYTVGLWHLNEASGNALDSSGNSNTLTNTSATVDTTTQLLGSAARVFSGGSQYLNNAALTPTISADFTIQFWFKTSTTPNVVDRMMSFGQAAARGAQIYMNTTGNVGFDNSGGPTAAIQTTGNYVDGRWHHVAMTRIGTNYTLYVDGIFIGTGAGTAPVYTNIYLGRLYDNETSNWAGTLDEAKLSNIARTPEQIKADASRRPSSTYTSPVLDLTVVASWNPFTWSEWGVATGDGETLKDATSLVAQWNFNETSGTAANNDAEGSSCGGTPANCDGTLTGFDSTASQDADPDSSWTANNRRWGAGALQFDGTDSVVTIGSESTFDFSNTVTLETWFNSSSTSSRKLISKSDGSNNGYELDMNGWTSGNLECGYFTSAGNYRYEGTPFTKSKWQHAVCVIDATQSAAADKVKLFLDGIEITAPTVNTAGTISTIGLNNFNVTIGTRSGASPVYYKGVMDTPRIYSRALTPAEIMSNYQAGNVEFQTRVGATTDPNDGSWEAWKPTTGETAIDSYDGPYQYNTTDSGLVSYWPMDETADNSCSGGEDACDRKTTNHGTATGTKIVDGKFGKARSFAGTSDYVSVPDSANWAFGTGDFTINTWVNFASISSHKGIIGQRQDGTNFMSLYWDSSNNLYFHAIDGGTWRADYHFAWTPTINTWYHLAVVRSGTTFTMYLNGVPQTLTTTTAIGSNSIGNITGVLGIGLSSTFYMNGIMDETQIWNSALSATTIKQKYLEGSTRSDTLHPMTDSTYKLEGSASQKIETGRPTIDGSTIALWHLDETGGNANNATSVTGLSLTANGAIGSVNGISGKARVFISTATYFSCTDANCGGTSKLDTSSSTGVTYSGWVYANSFPDASYNQIFAKIGGNSGQMVMTNSSGQIRAEMGNSLCNNDSGFGYRSEAVIPVKKWTHIAVTVTAANPGVLKIYVDGSLKYTSGASAYYCDTTGDFTLGKGGSGYWNGYLDEFSVSGTTRSDEEIAESYRAGRDHYINKTISSTDLSSKSSLPFYVAADRPGSYLSATIGESAFANYQPDANTVGLWHLAEQSGSGAYIKDSSGNGNHGSVTNTSYTQGKTGGGRYFAGNGYITVNSSTLTAGGTKTLEAWIKTGTPQGIFISSYDGSNGFQLYENATTGNLILWSTGGGIDSGISVTDNKWHHVVGTFDGVNGNIYIDGVLVKSAAKTVASNSSGQIQIGVQCTGTCPTSAAWYYTGIIDEVRISNTARTADEIRQAYEVGLRTHPITIDFGAKLDSGNLITGSGDLGFTVDATYYGLQNKGDMLFKGDKVIVRENYDGTEYIAQGTVDAITASTGATTVSAWDAGSTFPSGGYTVNASVFKWQREYWNPSASLTTHRNAITNLSLRLTDGAEGRTIWLDDIRSTGGYLTDSSGSTITSSTGSRYLQYRAILSSFDEAVSATISAVTVDYVSQVAPNTPSLDLPTDTATNQLLSPVLKTTATDTNSDYLRYKIELCTDLAMTTGCQTFDQTSSQTGWSGQNAQTSTAYTSGTQGVYTIQTPLSVATPYYWRSYAIDPGGTNTWSSTQGTPYSFTTTTAPTAPTTPYTEGASNPTGVIDTTPEFSAIHNDPDSDAANYYEIEVNTDSGFTGTVMWDTGAVSMSNLASGARSTDVSYAGTAIPLDGAGTTYYWRIRFTDVNGATGAWSATQNFTMNALPATPSLDSPTNTATSQSLTPSLKTTTTDTNSDYLRYKIQICTNLAMTTGCQTFDQTSSQTGWSGQNAQTSTAYTSGTQATYTISSNLIPQTTYYWRSYAIDPGGSNTWSGTQTPYSFTTVQLYESFNCLLNETADDSSLTLIWADRDNNEDSYKIERNVDDAGFTAFQTLAANTTSYQDTSITSGHTYQYRVAPYVSAGSTYGTWCTTSTLSLQSGTFNYSGLNFSGFNIN